MSDKSIEKMKKIIEDKKKKGLENDIAGNVSNKGSSGPSKGFKSNKRAGSLNK